MYKLIYIIVDIFTGRYSKEEISNFLINSKDNNTILAYLEDMYKSFNPFFV